MYLKILFPEAVHRLCHTVKWVYGTRSLRTPGKKDDRNKFSLVFDWCSRWLDLLEILQRYHCLLMNGKQPSEGKMSSPPPTNVYLGQTKKLADAGARIWLPLPQVSHSCRCLPKYLRQKLSLYQISKGV